MSSIERGISNPPDAVIAKIAEVLKCTSEEIRAALPDPVTIAEDERKFALFLNAVHAAKADAKSKGLGRGSAGVGSITCPACKTGTLRYSVAAINGHMHGACTTENCARWME